MSATGLPALPALDNTMGALFIGVNIATTLWGAGTMQVYSYFQSYPRDPLPTKALVLVVYLLDTVHQALITHLVYTYLVTEYGNPLYLGTVVWSLIVQVMFTALIAFLTQAFFLWRIYRLTHNNLFVSAVVGLVIIADFVASVIYFAKGLNKTTFVELQSLNQLSEAIDGLTVAADVAVAGGLIYALQTAKTGFERSNGVINRLIVFAISTGFLTSLDAIFALAFAVGLPSTFIYMAFYAPLSKLYVNSLMSNLNARKTIKGTTDTQLSSIPMQRYGQTSVLSRGDLKEYEPTKSRGRHPNDALNIQISTTTMLAYDRDMNSASEIKTPVYYPNDSDHAV